MTKMIIYTKGTVKIVENPSIVEKFQLTEESAIEGFYCTSQIRGSKLAEFSNSRFLCLFFTSKLAVPLLSTQIRDFCYFLSPKIREFGGITVLTIFRTIILHTIDLENRIQGI